MDQGRRMLHGRQDATQNLLVQQLAVRCGMAGKQATGIVRCLYCRARHGCCSVDNPGRSEPLCQGGTQHRWSMQHLVYAPKFRRQYQHQGQYQPPKVAALLLRRPDERHGCECDGQMNGLDCGLLHLRSVYQTVEATLFVVSKGLKVGVGRLEK